MKAADAPSLSLILMLLGLACKGDVVVPLTSASASDSCDIVSNCASAAAGTVMDGESDTSPPPPPSAYCSNAPDIEGVARPEVQSDCAIALANALREPGPSSWLLDDSENWSWFREFRLTVKSVQFREFVNTGEVCTKPLYSGPLCVFGAYQLSVAGQPRLQGRFDRSQPAGVVILPMPAVASGVVLVGAPLDADLWPFQVRLSVVGEPCGPP